KFTDEQREIYTTFGGYPSLDGDYTVFGEVTEGMEVVDKIAALETDQNNRPLQDVKMEIERIK
ncbi:MAG: peptidylprolyl isomerase, partial [Bacteroidales bacterium]|nr:peptidylprolyl isomerase [Bacteroidales bacterium]